MELDGLGLLSQVTGSLVVTHNTALRALAGLGSLKSVGADLEVQKNKKLATLTGLHNLGEVGGIVTIYGNAMNSVCSQWDNPQHRPLAHLAWRSATSLCAPCTDGVVRCSICAG